MVTLERDMTDKITESLYTRTKHLRGMSEEDRRRLAIEKAKSSTEAVISAYVRLEHKSTREFKTLSTGSVYRTEDYIDYNAFLKVLVRLISKFGNENTWKPEGDLIFKTDEGINQASIRDSVTRGSLVNMSDLAPHVFNLMKEQRLDSSRFFGRMCEAFLKRRLPEDVVTQIRETLWKVVEADKLFESDLGLNKHIQKKFDNVDAVDNISDYVDLGLPSGTLWCKHNYGAESEEEYGKYFIFRDIQKLDNVQIPSITDFIELNDYCHHKWIEINGINGMTFISMKNGNSVFFPAAGYCRESVEYSVKFCGCYWSSDEDSDNNMDGLRMHFINSAVFPNVPSRHKFFEFSVRTVRKP